MAYHPQQQTVIVNKFGEKGVNLPFFLLAFQNERRYRCRDLEFVSPGSFLPQFFHNRTHDEMRQNFQLKSRVFLPFIVMSCYHDHNCFQFYCARSSLLPEFGLFPLALCRCSRQKASGVGNRLIFQARKLDPNFFLH